jgi:membrane-associated PAP2 superfamily phosphatase
MFGYFLLRDRSRYRARAALAAGMIVGVSFALGQEARGAHFISHDLAAAAIVWFLQLLLYHAMLAPKDASDGAPAAGTSQTA